MEKKMGNNMETGEYRDLKNLIPVTVFGKPYDLLLYIYIYTPTLKLFHILR